MTKKIIYFDMDGVLVDFASGIARLSEDVQKQYEGELDTVPEIFAKMDPFEGAVDFVTALSKKFDVYILSTSPWDNPTALNDKLAFIRKHFGVIFYKRVIFSHNKHLNHGDYLIDDRLKNGADKFSGELIHFKTEKFPDYRSVLEYLGV